MRGPWAPRASVPLGVWHPRDVSPEGLGAWEGPLERARDPGLPQPASAESQRVPGSRRARSRVTSRAGSPACGMPTSTRVPDKLDGVGER